jgi:L-glyceraldehyde 3-phosphate reductase
MSDEQVAARIISAERRLLRPEVRQHAAAVDALLDSQFCEIGQSGRMWTRAAVIQALATHQEPSDFGSRTMREEQVIALAGDLFLLTYRLETQTGQTRRSSIWRVTDSTCRMVFHQGTRVRSVDSVIATVDTMKLVPYAADDQRYNVQPYRRCGRSGLLLPAISLGFWHNFGDDKPLGTQRAVARRAFDLGVTHFDLANNYGPPYGAAESNVGRLLCEDFSPYRDELVISTKAGWDMWSGPYGDRGSRKYLTASLDQSLRRLGLDYVDIFYHHRPDPDTPLEETMGALDAAVRAGKALYVGVSSYSPEHTAQAAAILRGLGTPLVIHQPSYSMFNRWIETGLLDVLEQEGVGCIAFTALAQGLLTDRYLDGVPEDSRAAQGKSLSRDAISEQNLDRVRALNEIAAGRGQSLAQLALSWVLRDARMTSTLIGASSVRQLEDNVAAARRLDFTEEELAEIEKHAVESGVDLWESARSSTNRAQ